MTHISGRDRARRLLLPESLDEYVGPDNPVRFIDAFVRELDLAAAGFARVTVKATGCPGYSSTARPFISDEKRRSSLLSPMPSSCSATAQNIKKIAMALTKAPSPA
jgi:hypothetical protein